MDPKRGPAGQTPNNIKDRQVTWEGVPQVGLDEQAVKLETDSDTRLAQGRDNLQEEALTHSIGAKEDAVYDQEDRSQRDRMSSSYPEIPKTLLKQGNTATSRVTPKGKSEKPAPHNKGNQGNGTIETKLQDRAEREKANGQTESHTNGRGKACTSAIVRTTPSRYKEQRESGERKGSVRTKRPAEVAPEATDRHRGQLNGLKLMCPRETSQDNELRK